MPRQTARVIVIRDFKGEKQLLVMERHRRDDATGRLLHYYSIPGGHIEASETPEAAVLREIDEEMNIIIKLGPPLAVVPEKDGGKHYYFVAKYISGEPYLSKDSPEVLQQTPDNRFMPQWVPLNEETFSLLHPVYQKLVPRILETAKGEIQKQPWRISEISL